MLPGRVVNLLKDNRNDSPVERTSLCPAPRPSGISSPSVLAVALWYKCFYWFRIRKLRLRETQWLAQSCMAFPRLGKEGGTQAGLTPVPIMLLIAMSSIPVFQATQGGLWGRFWPTQLSFCVAFLSIACGAEDACFRPFVSESLLGTRISVCVSLPVVPIPKAVLAELLTGTHSGSHRAQNSQHCIAESSQLSATFILLTGVMGSEKLSNFRLPGW